MRGGRPWRRDRMPRPTTAPAARGLDGFLLQRHVGQKPQGGRPLSRWRHRPGQRRHDFFPAWEVTGSALDIPARHGTLTDSRQRLIGAKSGITVKHSVKQRSICDPEAAQRVRP